LDKAEFSVITIQFSGFSFQEHRILPICRIAAALFTGASDSPGSIR
jgi:hypothetical protein